MKKTPTLDGLFLNAILVLHDLYWWITISYFTLNHRTWNTKDKIWALKRIITNQCNETYLGWHHLKKFSHLKHQNNLVPEFIMWFRHILCFQYISSLKRFHAQKPSSQFNKVHFMQISEITFAIISFRTIQCMIVDVFMKYVSVINWQRSTVTKQYMKESQWSQSTSNILS